MTLTQAPTAKNESVISNLSHRVLERAARLSRKDNI
jgi:hypothetical protein